MLLMTAGAAAAACVPAAAEAAGGGWQPRRHLQSRLREMYSSAESSVSLVSAATVCAREVTFIYCV